MGLRERKKQQTRKAIFETAARLFAERGFDEVTVSDVARVAELSDMTVFNYFPTKEDLFFGGMEFFEERLLEAVRERSVGETPLRAFARVVLESCERLGDRENAQVIAKVARLIAASPSLQAREREIVARYTQALVQILAAEARGTGSDLERWAVASALMGVHRALVVQVRSRILGGRRGPELVRETRAHARRAFARLEHGFAGYAVMKHVGRRSGS